MFTGNVELCHYNVLRLPHNSYGVQSAKRKRKGKLPLTGRKETTNTQQTVIFNEVEKNGVIADPKKPILQSSL